MSPISRGRFIRFAVALVLVYALALLGVGCSSTPPTAAPRVPSQNQAGWIAAVLGAPPDLSLFVRPTAARTDAYWGPLVARLLSMPDKQGDFISHGSGLMVLNSQQIDLHVAIRDPMRWNRSSKGDERAIGWLAIIHGIVPLDPLGLRTGKGQPLFAPPWRLPSGVAVYQPSPTYAQEYGPFAPTLFVLPDWTCIVTDPVAAPHARDVLAAAAPPPLRLDASGDSLGGAVFTINSLRFINADKRGRAAIFQNAVAAGVGLRGGNGAIDAYADYMTDDDAKRGYSALQDNCARDPRQCELEPGMFRDAKAYQDGRRVAVTLAFSEATLRSIREWTP